MRQTGDKASIFLIIPSLEISICLRLFLRGSVDNHDEFSFNILILNSLYTIETNNDIEKDKQ